VELRLIARAHIIAWRKDLDARKLAAGSIRRKMSALSSLYEFLTDKNAVAANPVKGVKRPKVDSYEGKTPAIADKEARQLESTHRQNPQGSPRQSYAGDPSLPWPAARGALPAKGQGHPLEARRAAPASPR
jgi:site-specific recombinase XerD